MTVIEVTNLHKRYRDHIAVADVSFAVDAGEIFGIVGRNGAGKTTTVECVGGLRRPDAGTVRVLGLAPTDPALRARLGFQLQESALPDRLRVGEALRLFGAFYDRPAGWRTLLRQVGLEEKENAPYAKLSGGQKQRLAVALALIGNPEVAILDELTTGLDPEARRDVWDSIRGIRDRGVTVVLVTHLMDEAERLCDRIAVIDKGRIVALDTPVNLIARTTVPGVRQPTLEDAILEITKGDLA
jgi:ABC-2 type transport system ATP-binding protein